MSEKLHQQHKNITTKMQKDVDKLFSTIEKLKQKGIDPENHIPVRIANTTTERVLGLLGSISTQLDHKKIIDDVVYLEKKYTKQDWRVACHVALKIAQQLYGKFETEQQAIEFGIRFGFSYITMGVVSSPLEGFTHLEIKDNQFYLYFAGPIRNAGGTAASVCVIIADYIRTHLGYQPYTPHEREQQRIVEEVHLYHNRVTNLQYFPQQKELEILIQNLPVAIRGNPTESLAVSDENKVDSISTQNIRGGVCLLFSECLALKSAKLFKQISKWSEEEKMHHWLFLENIISAQKGVKQHSTDKNIDEKFMSEVVGGRPVFGFSYTPGAFRLRYGRTRCSGYSAQAIHPATMYIVDTFLATGTQLRTQIPGKACTVTPCETIEPPIVLLQDGSVAYIDTVLQAKKLQNQIQEILFLGDILVNFGDFLDRAATLVPVGYCEEWWKQEVMQIIKDSAPISHPETYGDAKVLCNQYTIPLHPKYIHYWSLVSIPEIEKLHHYCHKHKELLFKKNSIPKHIDIQRILQKIGMMHSIQNNTIQFAKQEAQILFDIFCTTTQSPKTKSPLEYINVIAPYQVKDKSGTFVGARMGRPEKAKIRESKGNANGIFPQKVKIGSKYMHANTSVTGKAFDDWKKKYMQDGKKTSQKIKGMAVFETQGNTIEYLGKAHIRSNHNMSVNKDGTMRYDATQVPLTHFTPKEIGLTIEECKKLGYTLDAQGKKIKSEHQYICLHPQDIILPDELSDQNHSVLESGYQSLFRFMQCVDDIVTYVYESKKIHNAKDKKNIIGQYILGLAPHTSCGILGRVIGFSKQQALYAHPLFHAAMRRDCDGDEASILLLSDTLLNFSPQYLSSRRGANMDAALVIMTDIHPQDVDDMVFNVDTISHYPLRLYDAAQAQLKAWEVEIPIIGDLLEQQGWVVDVQYSHHVSSINQGVFVSRYKINGTMQQKVKEQMQLAKKIEAVDHNITAQKLLQSHFIRDVQGNLSRYYRQEFRDTQLKQRIRRPPMSMTSTPYQHVVQTLSFGSVQKYSELSKYLAEEYNVGPYIQSVVDILYWKTAKTKDSQQES